MASIELVALFSDDESFWNNHELKLIDITPERFRCGAGACSAVFVSRCHSVTPTCPSAAKIGDKYVIIGKVVTDSDHSELHGRIGEGECAIEIAAEIVEEAVDAGKRTGSADIS